MKYHLVQIAALLAAGLFCGTSTAAIVAPAVSWDARTDNDGDDLWQDATGLSFFDWELGSNLSPTAVSDPFYKAVTQAYSMPTAASSNLQISGTDSGGSLQDLGGSIDKEDYAIEIMFRTPDLTGTHNLFETGGNGDGTAIRLVGGNFVFRTQEYNTADGLSPGDDFLEISVPLNATDHVNQFVHIVVSLDIDDDIGAVWVDGDLAGTGAVEMRSPTNGDLNMNDWDGGDNASIGQGNGNVAGGVNDSPFDGEIAALNVYSEVSYATALSESDVETLQAAFIPEPSAFALALIFLTGALLWGRKYLRGFAAPKALAFAAALLVPVIAAGDVFAGTITVVVGDETIPDGSTLGFTNADSDGSLTGMLTDARSTSPRPDNFFEFDSDHDDFVTFNFAIPVGEVISSATLDIDITDDDNMVLTITEDVSGTEIGETSLTVGNQGSPGPWRAINFDNTGNPRTDNTTPGNIDHQFSVPATLFPAMQLTGQLVLDGSWSGTNGVYGSNRAKLTITTVPEPSSLALGVLGMLSLAFAARRRR